MLHERLLASGNIVERSGMIEDRSISGLTQISAGAGNKPERVIIEAAADVGIAALCEGLILMICRTVLELDRCDVDDPLTRTLGDEVHESKEVLTRISEAHSAAGTGLPVACRTAHVKCYHTLVLMPDVDHAVNLLIATFKMILRKKLFPVLSELCESCVNLSVCSVTRHELLSGLLVDNSLALPLFFAGNLDVTELEDEALFLTGCKCDLDHVRSDRIPSACEAVCCLACRYDCGIVPCTSCAEEAVTVGIKAVHGNIDIIESVMITSLSVLCLVVDGAADNLELSDA